MRLEIRVARMEDVLAGFPAYFVEERLEGRSRKVDV